MFLEIMIKIRSFIGLVYIQIVITLFSVMIICLIGMRLCQKSGTIKGSLCMCKDIVSLVVKGRSLIIIIAQRWKLSKGKQQQKSRLLIAYCILSIILSLLSATTRYIKDLPLFDLDSVTC